MKQTIGSVVIRSQDSEIRPQIKSLETSTSFPVGCETRYFLHGMVVYAFSQPSHQGEGSFVYPSIQCGEHSLPMSNEEKTCPVL